jgi:hypothetical protein
MHTSASGIIKLPFRGYGVGQYVRLAMHLLRKSLSKQEVIIKKLHYCTFFAYYLLARLVSS